MDNTSSSTARGTATNSPGQPRAAQPTPAEVRVPLFGPIDMAARGPPAMNLTLQWCLDSHRNRPLFLLPPKVSSGGPADDDEQVPARNGGTCTSGDSRAPALLARLSSRCSSILGAIPRFSSLAPRPHAEVTAARTWEDAAVQHTTTPKRGNATTCVRGQPALRAMPHLRRDGASAPEGPQWRPP